MDFLAAVHFSHFSTVHGLMSTRSLVEGGCSTCFTCAVVRCYWTACCNGSLARSTARSMFIFFSVCDDGFDPSRHTGRAGRSLRHRLHSRIASQQRVFVCGWLMDEIVRSLAYLIFKCSKIDLVHIICLN